LALALLNEGSSIAARMATPDEHENVVLQLETNGITKANSWPVTVREKNSPMALDSASARLYIACRRPPLLAVYDTRSGALLSQIPCVGDADDMFYDATLKRLYIIGGEGFVDVFQVSDSRQEPGRSEPPSHRCSHPVVRHQLLAAAHDAYG
jgi:hypothetical protein